MVWLNFDLNIENWDNKIYIKKSLKILTWEFEFRVKQKQPKPKV